MGHSSEYVLRRLTITDWKPSERLQREQVRNFAPDSIFAALTYFPTSVALPNRLLFKHLE